MIVRNPTATDEPAWRRLWDGYIAFYRATVPPAATARTWRRVLDPAAPIFARLVERNAKVVGFTIAVLHEATWVEAPVCYLEDLFVDPASRGAGLGRALLEDMIAQARSRDCARLYWHTQASNLPARRLYDRFAAADGFVRYRIAL